MGRVVRERKIEMVWRCSSCSHVNRGRDKECRGCGHAKDASEHFEMPSNTAAAESVTDPELLRHANAGADWRCGYCGSDQRKSDDTCAQCGAASDAGKSVLAFASQQPALSPGFSGLRKPEWIGGRRFTRTMGCLWAVASAVTLGTVFFFLLGWWAMRPFEATVTGASWRHAVVVERWAIVDGQGFAESRPGSAFDVRAVGDRHHHDEQVLAGYRTEHYTEQVACGEDCYDTPESCSESCSSDSNGFATCRTVCSGGGRSCSTRYCSESRTREVPYYRSEPRYATWYAWRNWEWTPHRTRERSGTGLTTTWPPDEEVALNQGLGEGERERATRRGEYRVALRNDEGEAFELRPTTLEDYVTYTEGRVLQVRPLAEGNLVEPAPAD